jgi:dolichyl-phosphate-mannose-protein mannosyltransferase
LVRVLLTIAIAATAWSLLLFFLGGFDRVVLGIRVRSNDPWRPLIVAVASLAAFFFAGGRIDPSRIFRRDLPAILVEPYGRWIAAAIALATLGVGLTHITRTAGGADAYGYVKVPQPWAADVPWPDKLASFAPLGYRPAIGTNDWAIVPTYSPGLPLLFAAAKRIGGQCALFALVPVLGAIAVFVTSAIGQRLGSPAIGLGGALLLAASPVFISHLMEPITDVPVTTAWMLALYFLLAPGRASLVVAGIFASVGIAIRPNLAVLVIPLALWPLIRQPPASIRIGRRFADMLLVVAGALPGILFIAWVNTRLYGSPFVSGYGSAADIFAWGRIPGNLRRFVSWLTESQTPIALLGFAPLIVPWRRFWPRVSDRSVFVVIGLYVGMLWLLYASYEPFESWRFLRFLLPSWPVLMLGVASALLAVTRSDRGIGRLFVGIASGAAIVALAAWQIGFAKRAGDFDQRQEARHYILTGSLVRGLTDPNSVVLTIQRSGSIRYYGGRVTLRYDRLPADTLDRDVRWLNDRGVKVYAALDETEIDDFKRKFASQKLVQALDWPLAVYTPELLKVFELTEQPLHREPMMVDRVPPESYDCVPPVRAPVIVLRPVRSIG